ncbi:hypothetical protein [Streptomyces ardesiacus]|uniref:hypothetical protein n=1 Tax=Streptomyces ardesiacus TaxID=285564 RepID=UPI000D59A783|nr:hypothetical protein [Streptomyces ardesiacus]
MAKRGIITDYAGEPIRPGDLISYACRESNRVRMGDAYLLDVKVERFKGRLIPFLLVKPTGAESGFTRRKTLRKTWILLEHVRLIESESMTPEELATALNSGK